MSRTSYLCDVCKLDKAGICNYECIKKRSGYICKLYTCPKFIYDDGQPMTNAELLCTDLKDDVGLAATGLWYQLAMDDGFATFEDFVEWLKRDAVID